MSENIHKSHVKIETKKFSYPAFDLAGAREKGKCCER